MNQPVHVTVQMVTVGTPVEVSALQGCIKEWESKLDKLIMAHELHRANGVE